MGPGSVPFFLTSFAAGRGHGHAVGAREDLMASYCSDIFRHRNRNCSAIVQASRGQVSQPATIGWWCFRS